MTHWRGLFLPENIRSRDTERCTQEEKHTEYAAQEVPFHSGDRPTGEG
ncbi:hypothetical protein F170042I7_37810 [Blautia caecimuris]